MVVTRGSSKTRTKTRRSRASEPKYSSRRKKKFDFAVYDQKLARATTKNKTKAAAQSETPPTNSTTTDKDDTTTKVGDINGNITTNTDNNKREDPKLVTRTALEGIGKVPLLEEWEASPFSTSVILVIKTVSCKLSYVVQ